MSDRHNHSSSHLLSGGKCCELPAGDVGLLGASSVSEAKADDEAFGTGLELSYSEYVHFTYKVGLYCKQRRVDEPTKLIKRSDLVSWYCRNHQKYLCKPDSLEYCKQIYKVAILNMLEDGLLEEGQQQPPHASGTSVSCLSSPTAVFVRTSSRFLLWAWTDVANAHEAQVDAIHLHRRGSGTMSVDDTTTKTTTTGTRRKHSYVTIKTTTDQQPNTTINLSNTTTTVIVDDDSVTSIQSKQQQQEAKEVALRLKQQQQHQTSGSARVAGFRGISGIRATVERTTNGCRSADSRQPPDVVDK
eukprot:GHVS01091421.1.p1 GENE.GHVS01091421.1~~GHVS01091421.1.p1  ORF type:complete len:301 (+),score=66.82 GHVS01091421.1:308-1210(+)